MCGILCLNSDVECEKQELDGPDVIECTDSNDSDGAIIHEGTTQVGKKIIANPSIWKINVANNNFFKVKFVLFRILNNTLLNWHYTQ